MLISRKWLEQFIDLSDISSEELANALTLRVAEVEEIKDLGKSLENIVVGKIIRISEHPNADALRCCAVDVGESEELPVVCGGSNIREGQLVAMGKVGAKVQWHGEGDLIELKKAKIRGEVSLGMICAADEIGLGEMFPKKEEKEILDLSHLQARVGTPLSEALGLDDVVFDIENKTLTHRPDLWGHYGMAREVAALFDKKLKPYKTEKIQTKKERNIIVKVEDTKLCPRYMAVAVGGVTVGTSPAWMQEKIIAAGMRPINTIVDITNYVMLELGQPMHAFDRDNLASPTDKTTIYVRRAKPEEVFVTLDEKEMSLTQDMLVIADADRAVALAGVKGGKNSGITKDTTEIVFESANFYASNVRKTSTLVGVRTDSSARFEKSLDPDLCQQALERAVALTVELCPGAKVISNVADEYYAKSKAQVIELSQAVLDSKVGYHIELDTAMSLLLRLGFHCTKKKDVLKVGVPSWRATKDISIKEDIIEEVIRLFGYENIPAKYPTVIAAPPQQIPMRDLTRKLRNWLSHEFRYSEVYNYSFVSPGWLEKLGISTKNHLELDNPIAKDRPLVRKYLVPNMLEHVEKNLHRYDDVRLFEIGKTFDITGQGAETKQGSGQYLPLQETNLIVMRAQKGNEVPFYNLSAVAAGVLERLGVSYVLVEQTPTGDWQTLIHPKRSANLMVGNVCIGSISEMHPATQHEVGIEARVGILHLHLSTLINFVTERVTYTPVAQYPVIERDIAFLVDASVTHAAIASALTSFDSLIVETSIFDVYAGKGIPDGKKSMAYRLVYRSDERTLETGEVDAIQKKLEEMLAQEFGAEIR